MLLYKKVLNQKKFDTPQQLTNWVNESEAEVSNITHNSKSDMYVLFYWKIEINAKSLNYELASASTAPSLQS